MIDKLKKHKCFNNGLYGHGRAWFRDEPLDASQLLWHMRITLN